MGNNVEPPKRVRRTKEVIEQEIINAAIKIIESDGFSGLTVTRLLQETKADPPVFYNRYKDINDFIDKFVRDFDYWLNDSVSLNLQEKCPVENVQNIMTNLVDTLCENITMQKLIAWEMNDNNYITRRTAQNRDNNSERLIQFLTDELNGYEVDPHVATAILLGGIYYLIIHRKLATFNKIDYNTEEGIALLKDNIVVIVEKIFVDNKERVSKGIDKKTIEIAKRLIENDVAYDIIKQSTGLSEKTLDSLFSTKKS